MSHWDSAQGIIVRWEPQPSDNPGWVAMDCGCSAGLQWGGEVPRECLSCGASGWRHVHLKSGVTAVWPGGPLNGRLDPITLYALQEDK